MNLSHHQKLARAVELLEAGLRSPIVVVSTGLPENRVRALAKDMNGFTRASSGALPGPASITKTTVSRLEASLWSAIYQTLGGQGVMQAVDIDSLIRSHRVYRRMRESLSERMKRGPHTINHTWVLARGLCSGEVLIHRCSTCDIQYLVACNPQGPCGCPVCALDPHATAERSSDDEAAN